MAVSVRGCRIGSCYHVMNAATSVPVTVASPHHWRTQRGGLVGSKPVLNLRNFFNRVFAQNYCPCSAPIAYSLNSKLFTEKR